MTRAGRRVVVVGGGVSGLTTALALADRVRPDEVEIQLRESSDRLGGKLRTSPFADLPAVDEGADAFLARVPHATALAGRVGLGRVLTTPTRASAAVWYDGLHAIPEGLLLGVPTGLRRLAGGDLLSWQGKARAALEPLWPAGRDPGDSIGALIRSRFGDEVHERLVDALIGSIYGADTDHFSLAMVPQLAELTGRGRSLLLSARRLRAAAPAAGGPMFLAPMGGMATLTDAIAAAARERGVIIRTGAPVRMLTADRGRWRLDDDAVDEAADVVVLATPAAPTAPLLRASAPEASRLMGQMDHAGVVLVTLAVANWPERLHGRSGYLVPKPKQRTVTAASFGSQKWAHWAAPGREIVRVSLGRDGLPVDHLSDEELLRRAVDEVGGHVDADLDPTATRVSRWPGAFPQYRPHHRRWLAAIAAAVPTGIVVTGASYGGIGVPACVAQAEAAAAQVAEHLAEHLAVRRA